ncbi:hypothetical protein ESCCO14588_A0069 (plasmid) [Escherichia coli O157:H7 str. TW14588]|nr:hypothetical protein ECH74115_B0103 [Escherichia coli O157:H7 str. EC4115]EDZ79151.1 hypothetical protein ECH7EC4206_C0023 [Escherichia coli O157:H7 str. EC4206]EEC25494.1 hypothetical protein ESCCO14588_A0069 [Escherichia coli O157:H7 str. TW14588]
MYQRCVSDSREHCNHRPDKCLLLYVFVIIRITNTEPPRFSWRVFYL